MVMRLIIKLTTPVKLNLINKSGQELITGVETLDKEVHYLQMEGIHMEYTVGLKAFAELFKMFRKRSLVLKNWTITDFDDYLKGNTMLRELKQ